MSARKLGKAKWDGKCIICLSQATDAAHIYPAGSFPELAEEVDNIVALCREHHTEFDSLNWRRKVTWLQDMTCKPIDVRQQLLKLHFIKIQKHGEDNGK
jgi:predicted restriction endonuclease